MCVCVYQMCSHRLCVCVLAGQVNTVRGGHERKRLSQDMLPQRPTPIPTARGAGTHARHKGIVGKHRFYIAPGFTLLCHHPGNTNAAQSSNIYSQTTHTHNCAQKHTHAHNTRCTTSGRVMTIVTSFFLFLRLLGWTSYIMLPGRKCLKKTSKSIKVNRTVRKSFKGKQESKNSFAYAVSPHSIFTYIGHELFQKSPKL